MAGLPVIHCKLSLVRGISVKPDAEYNRWLTKWSVRLGTVTTLSKKSIGLSGPSGQPDDIIALQKEMIISVYQFGV